MPRKKAATASTTSPATEAAIKFYQDRLQKVGDVFAQLVLLAKASHGRPDHPSPQLWLIADRLDQEALFAVQEKYTHLLGELAHALGPACETILLNELPLLFSASEKS